MDVDLDKEVIYSGESDGESGPKSTAKPDHKAVGAETTTAVPRDSLDKTMRLDSTSQNNRRGIKPIGLAFV